MSAIVVTDDCGYQVKFRSIAHLALLHGDWSDEAHIIISELLEVLFKKNIINGDDLIRILNMYHSKSIEKEEQP